MGTKSATTTTKRQIRQKHLSPKREKDTRIKSLAQTKQNKNTSLSNSANNHLRPIRRTIIFVQLDKQSSSSNSTNNHLCQTRQTIIFVKFDEQSSLSNSTNNSFAKS